MGGVVDLLDGGISEEDTREEERGASGGEKE